MNLAAHFPYRYSRLMACLTKLHGIFFSIQDFFSFSLHFDHWLNIFCIDLQSQVLFFLILEQTLYTSFSFGVTTEW